MERKESKGTVCMYSWQVLELQGHYHHNHPVMAHLEENTPHSLSLCLSISLHLFIWPCSNQSVCSHFLIDCKLCVCVSVCVCYVKWTKNSLPVAILSDFCERCCLKVYIRVHAWWVKRKLVVTCAVLGGQQRDCVTVGLKGSRTHSLTKTHTSALSNLALLELELLALLSKADFLKTVKRHIIKKHKHTKPSHTHTHIYTHKFSGELQWVCSWKTCLWSDKNGVVFEDLDYIRAQTRRTLSLE